MDAETLSTIVLLGSFLLMVFLRFPIAYSVGISTVLCLLTMGQKLSVLPMQMVRGVWSFSLMAVPFFITMGVLMGSGGISDKLIALANSLVGWMRGGLAMVNIVASYFFGGISGSSVADTSALGSILIPAMEKEGYPRSASAGITVASSTMGMIIPPSTPMVVYAMVSGASIGALFMAFESLGFDTTTLLASVGIFSLAISLGAKDLVADVVAGISIVFSGEYQIGEIIALAKAESDVPCAIGFGISTPEQAHEMAQIADGVIVGSAIVDLIDTYGEDSPAEVAQFVRQMKDAIG